jgi:hypothetical protein
MLLWRGVLDERRKQPGTRVRVRLRVRLPPFHDQDAKRTGVHSTNIAGDSDDETLSVWFQRISIDPTSPVARGGLSENRRILRGASAASLLVRDFADLVENLLDSILRNDIIQMNLISI